MPQKRMDNITWLSSEPRLREQRQVVLNLQPFQRDGRQSASLRLGPVYLASLSDLECGRRGPATLYQAI